MMSRVMTLLTTAVVLLTVPLVGLVRRGLEQRRHDEIQALALPSPQGLRGVTVTGEPFALADAPANTRFGIFVLHGEGLPQEVAAWNALQEALAPATIALVGACEDATCVARLRRGDASPSFTVLSSTGFSHGRLLSRLDDDGGWLLCDGAGGVGGRYPVPRDVAGAAALARAVQKPAAEAPYAQARS